MKLSAFEIADALHAVRPCVNTEICEITTDSRTVGEHTLFAALAGERFDGHDFIPSLDDQFQQIVFLTDRPIQTKNAVIVCEDVLQALADIAALHLQQLSLLKVAVTGSVGKTTTKEMIASVLSAHFAVQKSLANRNNELGMPLTAFSVTEQHTAAVFEMGMRGRGQIDFLARRVRPDIGVITNIGTSHMELLGSRENICKAKMELADCLSEKGVLLLNGDEPLLRSAAKDCSCQVRFFGLDAACDYRAENIENTRFGTRFTLWYREKSISVFLPVTGEHNVYNALAAFAVAYEAGMDPAQIVSKLSSYHDGGLRQSIYEEGGLLFFDDSYNASPESMRAALSVMRLYPNRKVAVLSDMLELGEASETAHREVGSFARRSGVDELICFGTLSAQTAQGFGAGAHFFDNRAAALEYLLKNVHKDDMILFKGSHAMACDKLLHDFKKRWMEH